MPSRNKAGCGCCSGVGNCTEKLPRTLTLTSGGYGVWTLEWDDALGGWIGCKVAHYRGGPIGPGGTPCPASDAAYWWFMKCGVSSPGAPALQLKWTKSTTVGDICIPDSTCATAPTASSAFANPASYQFTPYFSASWTWAYASNYLPPAGSTDTSETITIEEAH